MPAENFQPALNAIAVINLIGASQALLVAAALFATKHGQRVANCCFALLLGAQAAYIIMAVLLETGYILRFPFLLTFENAAVFSMGPFFYFYVRAALGERFAWRGKTMLHFLPAALLILLWLANLFVSPEKKIAFYLEARAHPAQKGAVDFILLGLLDLSLFAYLLVSLRKLMLSARRNDVLAWRWLRNLLIAFLAVQTFSAVLDILALDLANSRYTPLLLTVILCSLSYYGLRQSGMAMPVLVAKVERKYAKSALTEEAALELFHKLQEVMAKEKLFADSALSLPKLAKRLNASPHHLSQVLNARLQQSFFNYIGNLRMEEAKRRLLSPAAAQINISEIAYAVGFNSVSAFSTLFKKLTGMSPSQFQKQHGVNSPAR
ncbi:MAG: helix-turn-helix transcriptional regulator [candidate division KSB1 bacterium]